MMTSMSARKNHRTFWARFLSLHPPTVTHVSIHHHHVPKPAKRDRSIFFSRAVCCCAGTQRVAAGILPGCIKRRVNAKHRGAHRRLLTARDAPHVVSLQSPACVGCASATVCNRSRQWFANRAYGGTTLSFQSRTRVAAGSARAAARGHPPSHGAICRLLLLQRGAALPPFVEPRYRVWFVDEYPGGREPCRLSGGGRSAWGVMSV